MVDIEHIITLIKKNEAFKEVFHFETDDKDNFKYTIPEDNPDEFAHVNWIYLTYLPQATFIGILENQQVFTMDDEGSTFVLCDNFFEIPFECINIYIRGINVKEQLFNDDTENKQYLSNLITYKNWCNDNNIPIKKEYLDMITK